MKTIEEVAKEYATNEINAGNNPLNGLTVIENDKVQPFIDGAKYALSHQWISVKDEFPSEHHLWKYNENWTDSVLCEDANGNCFFNRMIKRHGKWIWMYPDSRRVKYWMPIPQREE